MASNPWWCQKCINTYNKTTLHKHSLPQKGVCAKCNTRTQVLRIK